MSCFIEDKRIVIGQTNKKAVITVCKNCSAYGIPHFNYISKKYEVTLSLLSAQFVDTFENIELNDRTDLEQFLNSMVSINEIQSNNKLIYKLNKQFFKKQRKRKKHDKYAIVEKGDIFFSVDVRDIEEDMTYWDLIVKLWNKHNEEKTPKNLCKPYYRNFQEYIDTASFGNEKDLSGGKCFTKQDQERRPHFIYKLASGEEFGILFEKAEYLYPIPRNLTKQELDILVNFLKSKEQIKIKGKNITETKWQSGIWLWNNQNYDYNDNSPNWFPKYKKLDKNTPMPDYTELNNEENEK